MRGDVTSMNRTRELVCRGCRMSNLLKGGGAPVSLQRQRLILFKINLLRFYLFIFRQKGREGEREEEKHQCVVASHVAPTGDLACNPGMCPDWDSNP